MVWTSSLRSPQPFWNGGPHLLKLLRLRDTALSCYCAITPNASIWYTYCISDISSSEIENHVVAGAHLGDWIQLSTYYRNPWSILEASLKEGYLACLNTSNEMEFSTSLDHGSTVVRRCHHFLNVYLIVYQWKAWKTLL